MLLSLLTSSSTRSFGTDRSFFICCLKCANSGVESNEGGVIFCASEFLVLFPAFATRCDDIPVALVPSDPNVKARRRGEGEGHIYGRMSKVHGVIPI